MKSVFDFIVIPDGKRYNNEVDVNGDKLIVNSSIENFKLINRTATVLTVPTAFETPIQEGDKVIIHHNVFRRYYNHQGKEVNSSKYFKDNMYFCQLDQIYLYKRMVQWHPFNNRCFVAPIVNKDDLDLSKEKKHLGILKHGNKSLESKNIKPGDIVGFTPNSEFEFVIDNELLYCMRTKDIVIKYENKTSETQYNPSWAKSS